MMHRSISAFHPLVLGSASPRRAEILRQLEVPFVVHVGEADEAWHANETVDGYLDRVTQLKLAGVQSTLPAHIQKGALAILVADTSVVCDGMVIGKPENESDAMHILARLSGRTHEVWTRFIIASCDADAPWLHRQTVRTTVRFRAVGENECASYVATGEGLDKAGGYAIQGRGAAFVAEISGSYTNVVGLPACEIVVALREKRLL